MPKKSERFTLEGSSKSKLCFPCSVWSTFFCASHAAWEAQFWNRLDPYGKNDIFEGGVKVAVAAAPCMFFFWDVPFLYAWWKYHSRCSQKHFCANSATPPITILMMCVPIYMHVFREACNKVICVIRKTNGYIFALCICQCVHHMCVYIDIHV